MKAEIIASGTELLLGEITDTNTAFIANQLAGLGIDLYYASIVGDNYERFLGVLKQGYQRSDILIITGGLGPTKGDITREVIAGFLEEKMEVDPVLQKQITEFFSRLGLEMPENNLRQANIIPSATAIPNPLGTAPGWWVEKNGKIIVSLPGPPNEMQPMWQKEIYPRLEKKGCAVIISRTLKTWGLSEAKIDQMVGRFMCLPNPTLALYAKPDGIQLRITAKAEDKETASKMILERESELRQILKGSLWGSDNDTLGGLISQLLIEKGLTVAVAESFTGGLLNYSLASAPDSHRFLKGGVIVIDENVRQSLEILPGPLQSADLQSASRMAALARKQFSADIGIGIDGYFQSRDGQISAKSFIALDFNRGEGNLAKDYHGRPYHLINRSVIHALFCLRKILLAMS